MNFLQSDPVLRQKICNLQHKVLIEDDIQTVSCFYRSRFNKIFESVIIGWCGVIKKNYRQHSIHDTLKYCLILWRKCNEPGGPELVSDHLHRDLILEHQRFVGFSLLYDAITYVFK